MRILQNIWQSKKLLVVLGVGAVSMLGIIGTLLVLGVQYGDNYVGAEHPSFYSASKFVVKKVLHEVKNGVYHGATVLNPPGDTLPDNIDTRIIQLIKDIL